MSTFTWPSAAHRRRPGTLREHHRVEQLQHRRRPRTGRQAAERLLSMALFNGGQLTGQATENAPELFILAKTASVHVSNIMSKLGVASRVEAAALAFRLGLGDQARPT